MNRVLERLYALLLALWVGAQCTVGYLVAPALFALLPDRMQAGTIAGHLFERLGWSGLAILLVLLVVRGILDRGHAAPSPPRWVRIALLVMLALTATGHLLVRPWIVSVRAQIHAAGGFERCDPALSAQFGRLHGLSSVLFLVVSALGIALLLRLRDQAARP